MNTKIKSSEHLSDQALALYTQRKLPPRNLIAANDHLQACDRCHQRLKAEARLTEAFSFARRQIEGAKPVRMR
jgi:hypothetical protein